MREGTDIYTRPEERQGAKDNPGEYTDLANNQGLRCKKVTQTHMLEFRWVRKTWLTHVIKFFQSCSRERKQETKLHQMTVYCTRPIPKHHAFRWPDKKDTPLG